MGALGQGLARAAALGVLDRACGRARLAGISANPAPAGQGPPGSLALAGWYTGPGGQRLSGAVAARLTRSIPDRLNSLAAVRAWLAQHHLTYWVSYQPAGRFWLVQGLAAACLLVISVLLVTASVRAVQRWRVWTAAL